MRTRRMLAILLGPLSVSACALIADLGDRTQASSETPQKKGDGAASSSSGSSGTSSGGSITDGPTTVPSFCTGITVYASFDTKLSGDRGGSTVYGSGGVTQSKVGKFGAALSLMADASTDETRAQGAALYIVASAAGNPWPENEGSLAVWYKQAPNTVWGSNPEAPILYRPVVALPPATLQTAGLAYYLFGFVPAVSGLVERSGDQNLVLVFDAVATAPYLRVNDYNHYFTAWRKAGTPTAMFAINGGLGTPLSGTGGAFPDASNGELHTPFKSFTSVPWVSEGPPVGVRLGGLGTNTPEGTLDDLVIWNRVISFEEAAAVYAANRAVGDICSLR